MIGVLILIFSLVLIKNSKVDETFLMKNAKFKISDLLSFLTVLVIMLIKPGVYVFGDYEISYRIMDKLVYLGILFSVKVMKYEKKEIIKTLSILLCIILHLVGGVDKIVLSTFTVVVISSIIDNKILNIYSVIIVLVTSVVKARFGILDENYIVLTNTILPLFFMSRKSKHFQSLMMLIFVMTYSRLLGAFELSNESIYLISFLIISKYLIVDSDRWNFIQTLLIILSMFSNTFLVPLVYLLVTSLMNNNVYTNYEWKNTKLPILKKASLYIVTVTISIFCAITFLATEDILLLWIFIPVMYIASVSGSKVCNTDILNISLDKAIIVSIIGINFFNKSVYSDIDYLLINNQLLIPEYKISSIAFMILLSVLIIAHYELRERIVGYTIRYNQLKLAFEFNNLTFNIKREIKRNVTIGNEKLNLPIIDAVNFFTGSKNESRNFLSIILVIVISFIVLWNE